MNLFRRKFVILRVTNFSYKEKLVTNNQFGQEYMNAGDIAGYHRISVIITAAAAVSAILLFHPQFPPLPAGEPCGSGAVCTRDQLPLKRVGHVAVKIDRNPVLLIHMKCRTDRIVSVLQLKRVLRINLQIVELPLPGQIDQTELLSAYFKTQCIRPVRATLRSKRKRKTIFSDFVDIHKFALCRQI